MCFCKCVCVLKLSHPAVILKVSSAFSSLPGELFPPSCLLSAGSLERSRCPCVAGPLRLHGLPSTDPDDGAGSLGVGCLFPPPSSGYLLSGQGCGVLLLLLCGPWGPPPHHRCAVHVTRSSTWKGASPTPQHVSAHAAGFLSKAVPVFLEGSDLWHLRSRLTPS